MFFCPLQRVLKPKPNAKMQLISQTLHHKLKKSYFLHKKRRSPLRDLLSMSVKRII